MAHECKCGGHGAGGGCCGGHVKHDHAQDDFDAPAKVVESRPATAEQRSFLQNFEKMAPLPIAKYLVKSSTEHSFENVALGDVCLRSANDSIALIKETAAFLQGLEASNLIAIDYETPMADDCYAHFYASDSYALFEQTVAEGGAQGFLGDTATLEKGSIVMTAHGKAQLAE